MFTILIFELLVMRGYESVLPVDVVDQKRSKAVLPEVAIYRKSSGFGRSIATFFCPLRLSQT